MNDEISRLAAKLDKLKIRRSSIIKELNSVEEEHNILERQIEQAKALPSQLVGKDAKGKCLHIGDSVTTLTKGRYYERIATVTDIKPDNHIDITYKSSKKITWRAGHNLLKLQ